MIDIDGENARQAAARYPELGQPTKLLPYQKMFLESTPVCHAEFFRRHFKPSGAGNDGEN